MSNVNEIKEFYQNDIVYRFNKRKRIEFGVVVDSYVESDDINSLKKGQIRVSWLNSKRESVWKQTKVRLLSRSIVPGDIVRRLENGRETPRGYCKESHRFVTVQIVGTDKIIENVASDRLMTPVPFDINTPVCLGTKYGRVQNVDYKIKMKSRCGSLVEFIASINSEIEDYWGLKYNRNYFENFYPGKEVICKPFNLVQPNWIICTKTMKCKMLVRQRFTVHDVVPTDLEVIWFDSPSSSSVSTINIEDIPRLKVAESSELDHLDLLEQRLLKLNSNDVILKKRDWLRKLSALHQPDHHKVLHVLNRNGKKERSPKIHCATRISSVYVNSETDEDWLTDEIEEEESDNGSPSSNTSITYSGRYFPPKIRDLVAGHSIAVEVLCMDSKVTVVWQDGYEERNIPTTQLYYSMSLDDHEFFPGECVVEDSKTLEFGVIQHVNHIDRTAAVKWFKTTESGSEPALISTHEESVYDLCKHPMYAFRPGCIVKRIPVEENKLGSVLDTCPDGYVTVHWVDGSLENCWPTNLELLPESLYSEIEEDDNSTQISWETESIESCLSDLNDEASLKNMATRLDFVRNRLVHLREALKQRSNTESFYLLKELLAMYDNSSYLDKLLNTCYFSLKSQHFQLILAQIKEKAKGLGLELRGRLFATVESLGMFKGKYPEKENVNRVIKMQQKLTGELEKNEEKSELKSPDTCDCNSDIPSSHENICVELISMMKVRMDLAYAEIISRIGGPPALSVMTLASSSGSIQSLIPISSLPTTPEESQCNVEPLKATKSVINCQSDSYALIDEVHTTHRFYKNSSDSVDKSKFIKTVQKEYKLLKESLPDGVWVRCFENRLDLLSVMIRGPSKTPYEDGLFLFDIQLGADYPNSPPLCHYISYNYERLNPNLYVEGKVCISLLGTWVGQGTEIWNSNSTLLQLIVSIQGLILVAEPYYNEAGYEKQMTTQQGHENSRTYNELVILKLVQSMTEMLLNPPVIFKGEVYRHFKDCGNEMCTRLEKWCDDSDPLEPDFPLLPVSKGLKLSLQNSLSKFKEIFHDCLKNNSID